VSIRPPLKILAIGVPERQRVDALPAHRRTRGVAVDALGFAAGSRLAGGLLGDPGVSFVEVDSTGGRYLGGEPAF
jgi:hypothetical protein